MLEKTETNNIWKQISGAEQLLEIYGYFPTLHDAIVENIDIRFELKQLTLEIRYNDIVEKSAEKTEVKRTSTTCFQICWCEVKQAKLNLSSEDLYGISFRQTSEFIETHFANYEYGFDGFIVARTIEIKKVKQISETDKQESYPIKLNIDC
jgi:Immunity protein 50